MAWLTEVEKAYLAGIIDGEGSIGIYRDYRPKKRLSPCHRSRMRITNTSVRLIEGQGAYHLCVRESREVTRKTTYELELGDRLTVKLLKEVLNYLVIKKSHALNVLALKDTFGAFCGKRIVSTEAVEERDRIYYLQKQLNMRGAP